MKRIATIIGAVLLAGVLFGCGDAQKEDELQKGLNALYGLNETEVNYEEAFRLFSEAAEAGNARAMYYQGLYYQRQYKISEEVDAYEKAIENNDDLARLGLGMRYIYGNGADFNFEKARSLFETALENGCVEANFGMGILYEDDSYGVKRDTQQALQYFDKATKGEDPYWVSQAYNELAYIYWYGKGVEVDLNKALEYEIKANEVAQKWETIYLIREAHLCNEMEDTEKAGEYANKAIEENERLGNSENGNAFNMTGVLYENGKLVDENPEKAMEYYQKAAEKGNPVGFFNIGLLYNSGKGVAQNREKALEYFQKAADLGYAGAYGGIANVYYYGCGQEPDYQKTMEYSQKAADLGVDEGIHNIGILYYSGQGVDQDYKKAKEYFEEAANAGCGISLEYIGLMYLDGKGVEPDYELARSWCRARLREGYGVL